MKRVLVVAVTVLWLVFPLAAMGATTFSTVVAVGDSLTDNGTNPDENDTHGIMHYTDGKVWVEMLSGIMGSSLSDVAYGGATTGYDNPAAALINPAYEYTGLLSQVENAIPAGSGGANTLFTVWAGANDFFQGWSYQGAVANIVTALTDLTTRGAENLLVLGLPDLGLTPAFYGDANPYVPTAVATGWSLAFNDLLLGELQTFAADNRSTDIYFLDINSIFSDFILMDDGTVNPVYWQMMFWDDVHPTSLGHTMVAGAAYEVLQTGPMVVPVPAAFWLLGSGFVGLACMRRKSKR